MSAVFSHTRWLAAIPRPENRQSLFDAFKTQAELLTVRVLRVQTAADASNAVIEVLKSARARTAAVSPLTITDGGEIERHCRAIGIDCSGALDRDFIERADVGISEFGMGIAESGTVVQDASSLHCRLVSMLPLHHIVLLPTSSIVANMTNAIALIGTVYAGDVPPYIAFVTGPSRTADIERRLTIGVHGPETVTIICIDEVR